LSEDELETGSEAYSAIPLPVAKIGVVYVGAFGIVVLLFLHGG
jgi:hypothetical protein